MDEIRIHELSESTELANGDNFVIDNANSKGTKRYSVSEFMKLISKLVYEWTPMVGYGQDVLVTYEGKLYRNKTDSTAISPTWQGSTVWEETNLNTVLYRMIQSFAPLYDSSMTYQIRQKCIHNYRLYSCKSTTTGTWDSTKWDEVDIVSYIKGTVLSNFTSKRITSGVSEFVEKGEIYIINDYMYKAIVDTQTSPLDMDDWEEVTVESLLTDMADEIEESIEPSIETALALGEASGSIASFTDGSTLPMRKLEVAIEPQQNLHGYDNPWVGGSGKNKLNLDFTNDTDSFSGLTFSHTDSTIKFKGTVSGQSYKIFNLTLPPNVDLNTDYTLSAVVTGTVSRCLVGIYFKTGNTDVNNIRINLADSTPKNTKQVASQYDNATFVIEGLQSGDYFDCEVKLQLEKGGIATAWQPYSNICPISGWDECKVSDVGINLWDEEVELISDVINSKNYIPVKPNTQYYFTPHQGRDYICYDKYYNVIKDWTWFTPSDTILTTPSNCYYIKFRMTSGYGTTYNHDISINYPSTDTDYHAYNGHTYTIDLDGTRYGGKLDVVSGVLTVDKILKTLVGTETWTYTSTYNRVYTYISDAKKPSGAIVYSILSDKLHFSSGVKEDYGAHINNAGNLIVFAPSSITSDDQWKTWLASNNVQVVYELATPQTIQLTPTEVKTLLAPNNIFADTGEVLDATYVRNANITINELIRRIENLEG